MRATRVVVRAVSSVAAVVLLAACSSGSGTNSSATSSSSTASTSASPTTAAAAAQFCAEATNAFRSLSPAFSGTASSDPASLAPILEKAAAQIRAITPPPEIAADWETLATGLEQFAAAYSGVRTSDPAAASSFAAKNARLLASLSTAVSHVQAYMSKNCGLTVPPGAPTGSPGATS
jgi:hypothetical protein